MPFTYAHHKDLSLQVCNGWSLLCHPRLHLWPTKKASLLPHAASWVRLQFPMATNYVKISLHFIWSWAQCSHFPWSSFISGDWKTERAFLEWTSAVTGRSYGQFHMRWSHIPAGAQYSVANAQWPTVMFALTNSLIICLIEAIFSLVFCRLCLHGRLCLNNDM